MGVDEIICLCDDCFAGADTVATTKVLAKAIQTIGPVELILCGEKAVDGETGQVPIGLAERLKVPVIIGVEKLQILTSKNIGVIISNENEKMEIKLAVPVICVFRLFLTESSRITLFNIKKNREKSIKYWDAEKIGIEQIDCGLLGSKTKVVNIVLNQVYKESVIVEGTIKEKVERIHVLLLNEGHYGKEEIHLDCM